MSTLPLPNTEFAKRPLWNKFTVKDVIYFVIVALMLVNQHFNNEQRLEKLEYANVQIADTLTELKTQMVPRKENDLSNQAISIRLGNIEASQNNILTYLMEHGK